MCSGQFLDVLDCSSGLKSKIAKGLQNCLKTNDCLLSCSRQ